MGIYLNPANNGFEMDVNTDTYVDKSELISFANSKLGTSQRYLCVSRPRRFGKTTAARMLSAYYSKGCLSDKLFCDLKIAKDKDYNKHLNKYNVLFLNIQRFLSRSDNPSDMIDYLQSEVISELSEKYDISLNTNKLSSALEKIFAATGDTFVFIIDEWDCIFREQKDDEALQLAYLDFLRDLLKDQDYVLLVYMTGILPIKKYGTHSALNMFSEYSMTRAENLAKYFGFTDEEVSSLCQRYNVSFDNVKLWYNGYTFGDKLHIYNPNSVIACMQNGCIQDYWTNTETYEALKLYIDLNFDGLKDSIISMMCDKSIKIDTTKFLNDMSTFESKDDILTLLVHLGYLTYNHANGAVKIPNLEVMEEFIRAVSSTKWDGFVEIIKNSDRLLSATLSGDESTVAQCIEKAHMDTSSVLTYNDENSLSYAVMFAYIAAVSSYERVREFPTGRGFADIVYLPVRGNTNPAIVVELKWDKSAQTALDQIKEKQYPDSIKDYYGSVVLVGINYDKDTKEHQCKIEFIDK